MPGGLSYTQLMKEQMNGALRPKCRSNGKVPRVFRTHWSSSSGTSYLCSRCNSSLTLINAAPILTDPPESLSALPVLPPRASLNPAVP